MKQNRLARLLLIDETVLSKIVNGFRKPDAELRTKIATVLQSDEAWLFEKLDVNEVRTGTRWRT